MDQPRDRLAVRLHPEDGLAISTTGGAAAGAERDAAESPCR
jgi:hypothetical protein